MKQLFSIKREIEGILKEVGLKDINLIWEHNFRLSRVVAKVSYGDNRHITLTLGDKFFKQCDETKIRVLKHEIAHVYDRFNNERRSKHDKIFKDLCERLYGDRTIGQATTKNWENWNK